MNSQGGSLNQSCLSSLALRFYLTTITFLSGLGLNGYGCINNMHFDSNTEHVKTKVMKLEGANGSTKDVVYVEICGRKKYLLLHDRDASLSGVIEINGFEVSSPLEKYTDEFFLKGDLYAIKKKEDDIKYPLLNNKCVIGDIFLKLIK